MLFVKCVQRLPFSYTYLTLCRYQVWKWRDINNCYSRRFCDSSLFIEQVFLSLFIEFIYEIIFMGFSYFLIFLENIEKENTWIFRLHKYVNVPQLPIFDTVAVLHVVYHQAISLESLFLLYIFLCILGKWQMAYCFHS